MYYSVIKDCDIANGPGVRVVLFVSGCRNHCPECFQPQTWDFAYGQPFTQDTVDEILRLLEPDYIQGLTLLGGEPFEPENQPPLLNLVRQVRAKYGAGKDIWAFTGYTLDQDLLPGRLGDPEVTRALLSQLDVLVDGRFVAALKNLSLQFRGSSNQRLIRLPETLATGRITLWDDQYDRNKKGNL